MRLVCYLSQIFDVLLAELYIHFFFCPIQIFSNEPCVYGRGGTFSDHLNALRLRHERKTRFIEQLAELDRTG